MAETTEVAKVVIKGDTKRAVSELKRLGLEVTKVDQKMDRVGKSVDGFANKLNAAFGAAAIAGTVRTIDDLVSRSIKFGNVMGNLKFPIDGARKATKGLITDFDLARAAVAATSLGITKSEDDFAKFSRAAVVLGSKLGIDTAAAMDQLTAAVGRGSAKILDNFGIMAKGFESMSMEDRLDLINNAVAGTSFEVDKNAQAWNRLKNELDNAVNDALPALVSVAGFAADEILGMAESVRELKAAFDESGFTMEGYAVTLENVADLYVDSQKHMLGVAGFLDELVESTELATDANEGYAGSTESIIGGYLEQIRVGKKVIEMTKEQQREFDKTFGIEASGDDNGAVGLLQGPLLGASAKDFGKGKRGGSRGRDRVDPLSTVGGGRDRVTGLQGLDLGAADAENVKLREMELARQEIELMEARRESTLAVLEAKIRLAEEEGSSHDAALLREEFNQEQHAMALERAEREAAAIEKAEKQKQAAWARSVAAQKAFQQISTGVLDTVAMAAAQSGDETLKVREAIDSAKMFILAGTETAESVAAFAGQNYLGGVLHAAAAATAVAQGVLIQTGAKRNGHGGSGGGGGSLRDAANARDAGPVDTGGDQGGGSEVPISPLNPAFTQSGRGEGRGGSINITVQGDVVGGSADEISTSLAHKLQDGERRTGEVI